MLSIIVVGAAGRMGKRLVALTAEDPQLELVGAVDVGTCPVQGSDAGLLAGVRQLNVPLSADLAAAVKPGAVVIDFSAGAAVLANARIAVAAGAACVIGSTGAGEADRAGLRELAAQGGRVVFAPNYSIGVNLLFALCRQVAGILGDDYDIEIVEMHHNQKKDAPSGTAERLGEVIAQTKGWSYRDDTVHGREGLVGARPKRQIGMHAVRGGDVVGDHTVIFASNGERIELTHKASSRDTFAKGALRAAKWLASAPPGLYDMSQVLGL